MKQIITTVFAVLAMSACAAPTGGPGLSLGSGGVFSNTGGSSGTTSNPTSDFAAPGTFQGTLDPHQVTPLTLASDFANWPETTQIKSLEILGANDGVRVTMSNGRPDSWPDTAQRPSMGPLLYTFGMAEKIDGKWYMSAPVQLWRGLASSGGPIQNQNLFDGTGRGQIQGNWFYDEGRWGPLARHQPRPGEIVGFFICAGDCRDGNPNYSPVHERSNIVLFAMPNDGQTVTINIP